MAQAYPYWYQGRWTDRQEKCRSSMRLDKARIWLDFNELWGVDPEDGAPVYLFSQGDVVNDSTGADVELYEGMEVSVFDEDFDGENRPDPLLAEGVVLPCALERYPAVKWLLRLKKHGDEYAYCLSDLE